MTGLRATEADVGIPSSLSSHRKDVQGLRAIAVLAVVAFHAGLPLSGGFTGVDIFFTLSGFVITAMLLRERWRHGRIRLRAFYWRRFKRLMPALALLVATVAIFSSLILPPFGSQQNTAATGIGAMLSVANFVIALSSGGYFDAPAKSNALLNTWSLSVEEQFYFVFPPLLALVWFASRRQVPSARNLLAVVVVTCATIASFLLAINGPIPGAKYELLSGFYSPLARAWEFSAGALLALALTWRSPNSRVVSVIAGAVGGVALAASFLWIDESARFPGPLTALPVGGTLLLLLAGSSGSHSTNGILTWRPLGRFGDWSYSIYLWHWPCIVFATILWPTFPLIGTIAAVVSLVPALLSYRLVENRYRFRDFNSDRNRLIFVTTVLAIPVTLSLILGRYIAPFWEQRLVDFSATYSEVPPGYELGCHSSPENQYQDPVPCTWEAEEATRPVYLLGDSNAAQFTTGLIRAAERARRPLIVTTSSACPLLDLVIVQSGDTQRGEDCRERTRRLLNWTSRQEPGTVLLGMFGDYWLDPSYSVRQQSGGLTSKSEEKTEALREGLKSTVRSLQSQGHEVILIQPVPYFVGAHEWDPNGCSLQDALRGCPASMPLRFHETRMADVLTAVAEVGSETNSAVVDVAADLCPDGICRTYGGGMVRYRDGYHISNSFSRSLSSRISTWLHPSA